MYVNKISLYNLLIFCDKETLLFNELYDCKINCAACNMVYDLIKRYKI